MGRLILGLVTVLVIIGFNGCGLTSSVIKPEIFNTKKKPYVIDDLKFELYFFAHEDLKSYLYMKPDGKLLLLTNMPIKWYTKRNINGFKSYLGETKEDRIRKSGSIMFNFEYYPKIFELSNYKYKFTGFYSHNLNKSISEISSKINNGALKNIVFSKDKCKYNNQNDDLSMIDCAIASNFEKDKYYFILRNKEEYKDDITGNLEILDLSSEALSIIEKLKQNDLSFLDNKAQQRIAEMFIDNKLILNILSNISGKNSKIKVQQLYKNTKILGVKSEQLERLFNHKLIDINYSKEFNILKNSHKISKIYNLISKIKTYKKIIANSSDKIKVLKLRIEKLILSNSSIKVVERYYAKNPSNNKVKNKLVSLYLEKATVTSKIKAYKLTNNVKYLDMKKESIGIIGSKSLNGAKFLGNKIWQDQKINSKIKYINYAGAKKYCKNLNLFGIQAWTLPSVNDFEVLDDDRHKLTYIPKRNGYLTDSFSNTTGCSSKGLFKISKKDCVYGVDIGTTNKKPYISKIKKKNKNSVRCVLDTNIYNFLRKHESKKFASLNTLDGFLKTFTLNGEKKYIKKALSMAKTQSDKAKVEKTLYNYIGGNKVFDIKSNGEIISDDSKRSNADIFLFKSIQNSKNLKHKFTISLKDKTPLQLKHNTYTIKVRFNLKLTYVHVMKKVFLGMDFAQKNIKNVPIETTFVLSPQNNYSLTKTLDFGSVNQGGKSSLAVIFKMESKLRAANIEYEILSTDIR